MLIGEVNFKHLVNRSDMAPWAHSVCHQTLVTTIVMTSISSAIEDQKV